MAQDSNHLTNPHTKRLKRSDFKYHYSIESFEVKIKISSNSQNAIDALKKEIPVYLPDCYKEIDENEQAHRFLFVWNESGRDTLYRNGKTLFSREKREFSVESAASQIRLTVAEFAAERVFIHAGVVSWKDRAVILPGKSFWGKTSLTKSLVERGALYYSDEYAILDREGILYPFPKMLSVRDEKNDQMQTDVPVERFGGRAGTEKIPVGMVLICEYSKKARWNPKILSAAQGVLEIIRHTVPIRQNPKFTLDVLNRVAASAVIAKSKRPDAEKSADTILKFIDDNL